MNMKVICSVDKIQFDPEDEITNGLTTEQIVYYLYVDQECMGCSDPSKGSNP